MLLVGKKTVFGILAMLSCFAPLCNAVGFGNLKVNSYLKQPLSATIQLTGCHDIDPILLQARLASPRDFDRAGVSRTAELYNLIFEVIDDDRPKISIRTTEPIQSQYLEFLIELEWDNGKLVKDYVILLDAAPKNAKKKEAKKPVATAAKAVTKKAEPKKTESKKVTSKKETAKSIGKKAKTTAVSAKSDTPLLPNVVPDIADMEMNIEVTKSAPPVQAATIISNIKSVIKTELATKIEPTIQTEPIAKTAVKAEPIIQTEPITAVIPEAIPQQENIAPATELPAQAAIEELTPATEATTEIAAIVKEIPQRKAVTPKPIPLKEVPPAAKAIPAASTHNYIYLIITLVTLLMTAVISFVIKRKYSSKEPVIRIEPIKESTVIMNVPTKNISKDNVLQMKIDLAKQYMEIGDQGSARELLCQVIAVANGTQKSEAEKLDKAL